MDTWSRPQSKCEKSQLYVEAIPLQSATSSYVDNNTSKTIEVISARDRIEHPPKVVISPKNRSHSASPHSPIKSGKSMTKDEYYPIIYPSSPIVKSPPYSRSNSSNNNHHHNNNNHNNNQHNQQQHQQNNENSNNSIPIYNSPKVSKRSLSYDHLQKEKRIQLNKSFNQSNNYNYNTNNTLSSPTRISSASPKVTLFVSEKVVLNPSNESSRVNTGKKSRGSTGNGTRSANHSSQNNSGRFDEAYYNKMVDKSYEILNQLENNQE